MRIRGISFGEGGGGGGCMGCSVGPIIGLIVAFLVGVIWSTNYYHNSPWRHFYLPSWAYVVIGGVAVFIIFTTAIVLNTASNTAAIWAAGQSGQRRDRTVHVETEERIRELADVQRVQGGQIGTLLREKLDLRRELAATQQHPALPAPERFEIDSSIMAELESMDVVDANVASRERE